MQKSTYERLTREHVLRAVEDMDAGVEHEFGPSKGWKLLYAGKSYPPKAIVGIALSRLHGRQFSPYDLHGGEGTGNANDILRDLGFIVERIQGVVGSGGQDGRFTSQLRRVASRTDGEGYFNPQNLQDERERRLRAIVERRGQPEFRAALIAAYAGRCAVTGCDAVSALEAAHVTPYLGPDSNHVSNGLLLRADIHTLFDLDLIGIDPDPLEVVLSIQLEGTCYNEIKGNQITLPADSALRPSKEALLQRWEKFNGA